MAEADEKRREVDAAFAAWDKRPRDASREETDPLWRAMWDAADFSWDGLKDAGWELGSNSSAAQDLKRWRAPADFPGGGDIHGKGKTAWKKATLQDYWRWSIGIVEGEPRLLTDDALIAAGLLVDIDGKRWHVLHRPEVTADADAALAATLLARLAAASGYAGDEVADSRVLMSGARAQGLDAVWRRYGAHEDPDARKTLRISAPLARFDQFNASALKFGDGAGFNRAAFGDRARFDGAAFGDRAGFDGAAFGDGADFDDARFKGRVVFHGRRSDKKPTFAGAVSFKSARFDGPALFGDNSTQPGASFAGRTSFRAATFSEYADFSRCTWPQRAEDQHGAFENARFRDVADFNAEAFDAFALFHGAAFERPIRFADPQAETAEDGFRRAVAATEEAIQGDAEAVSAAKSEKDRETLDRQRPPHERGADARWAALAGGFRALKLAMEAQSDQDRQQRFYRFELRARLRRPSTPWWERRVAGPLYWASSDYGMSIKRPFVALFALIFVFASFYAGVAALVGVGWSVFPPVDFSISQSVRPFGVWWGPAMPDIPLLPGQPDASLAARLEAAPWRVQLAHGLGQAGWTGVKVLATVQSFFSIVLLFLFALAVRRRFQIS